jgi:hypothetical protein
MVFSFETLITNYQIVRCLSFWRSLYYAISKLHSAGCRTKFYDEFEVLGTVPLFAGGTERIHNSHSPASSTQTPPTSHMGVESLTAPSVRIPEDLSMDVAATLRSLRSPVSPLCVGPCLQYHRQYCLSTLYQIWFFNRTVSGNSRIHL